MHHHVLTCKMGMGTQTYTRPYVGVHTHTHAHTPHTQKLGSHVQKGSKCSCRQWVGFSHPPSNVDPQKIQIMFPSQSQQEIVQWRMENPCSWKSCGVYLLEVRSAACDVTTGMASLFSKRTMTFRNLRG